MRAEIEGIELPEGYSLEWGGEYEDSGRARAALAEPLPYVLALMVFIVVCLLCGVWHKSDLLRLWQAFRRVERSSAVNSLPPASEVAEAALALQHKIVELQTENARLRTLLGQKAGTPETST